ncbi:MAG: 50S ribosomal protein L19 [Patescibacteria group bacterium]|jgi:large subunit ribosomal protein L19
MSEEKNITTETVVEKTATVKVKTKKKKVVQEIAIDPAEVVPGMTVRVYQKIKEISSKGEEKERLQYFEGLVIARKHGKEKGATITVRKTSEGVGVEKIFPLNAPTITEIIAKKQVKVRRAKLNFLRGKYTKRLKKKVIGK